LDYKNNKAMSENFFDDIGFDLVEKIVPPSLPDNIIGRPALAPIPFAVAHGPGSSLLFLEHHSCAPSALLKR
jgi:hypothetical protein